MVDVCGRALGGWKKGYEGAPMSGTPGVDSAEDII